jgi:hypothetical protein
MPFIFLKFLIAATLFLIFCKSQAGTLSYEVILPETKVDADGDTNSFATSFDVVNNQVFTAHVESAVNTPYDLNLRTVVRSGEKISGKWIWQHKVIESQTILDPYHTQASIAVDKNGYVHVVYNMHNMPWQYSVSTMPYDISSFEFKGQKINYQEKRLVKTYNKTPFPTPGEAKIPGNQITYPTFFKDNHGELYLTYRFALKPALAWENRAFAGAIAKYNAINKIWSQLGGVVEVSSTDAKTKDTKKTIYRPFAFQDRTSVYLTTLAFDYKNNMHGFWGWRIGGAGAKQQYPSYFQTKDGHDFYRSDDTLYKLPINIKEAEKINNNSQEEYYHPKSVAVLSSGHPVVVIHSIKEGRQLVYYNKSTGWSKPEPTPWGASEIVVDKYGRVWAFATGFKVFVKDSIDKQWQLVGDLGNNLCSPKIKYIYEQNKFFVHGKTCDKEKVTIISFDGN